MANAAFLRLGDEYVRAECRDNPGFATALGVHEFDGELPDLSQEARDAMVRTYRRFLQRLEEFAEAELDREEQLQRELLQRRIQWRIASIEELRPHITDPALVLNELGRALQSLMVRDFAPLPERARSLISRVRQAPRLFAQARATLERPSRIHTETALERLAGLRRLLADEVPPFLAKAGDALARDGAAALEPVLQALDSYEEFLRRELLPRSDGPMAIGPVLFEKQLRFEQHVDTPLEALRKRAEDDLRTTQDRLRELAARIDRSKSASEVVDEASREHPPAERLLAETAGLLESLRQFCIERRLVTMPTEDRPMVAETPQVQRATTQAACSTPGPFEEVAKESYYYVTPPDPQWPPERTESYLRFFNRYALPLISAHEVYPGHFVHLIALRQVGGTPLARLLRPGAVTTEGWAHYIEQVMIEAGYGEEEPRFELMQLREALLRLCRYLVSFGIHLDGWSFEEATAFFQREGYATPVIAEREARRGVTGPNYYAYTLGKHEILALRERYRAAKGGDFRLQEFHDRFIRLPYPVGIIQQLMLAQE